MHVCVQCVRLLAVSSPRSYYGVKFTLVTDVLDTLAGLVLARLQR